MNCLACSPIPLLKDDDFIRLKEYIIEMTGLAYYRDRDAELAHRLGLRLESLGLTRLSDYLDRLECPRSEDELDQLVEQLTIGETHFFRHPEMFAALRDVVAPAMFRENRCPQVRVWSAACANGAETYSIAITLMRDAGYDDSRFEVSILGTDINRAALLRARRGEYKEWDLRGANEEIRGSCFSRRAETWSLLPEYRVGVEFQYHNLVRHPFPSLANNLVAFDLILCRNALMYFDRSVMARLVRQFHECLVDGGWLLVGHAEPSPDLFDLFEVVPYPGAVLYRKGDGSDSSSPAPFIPQSYSTSSLLTGAATPPRQTAQRPPTDISHSRNELGNRESPCTAAAGSTEVRRRVREMADRGDLEGAAKLCRESITNGSLDPIPYLHLALIADQQGKHDESVSLLKKALYLDAKLVVSHYHLGLALQRLGRTAEARRAFENAIALLPNEEDQLIPQTDGLNSREFRVIVELQWNGIRPSRESEHGD